MVRVIDAMPAGEDLTVSVDGVKGSKTLRYGDGTPYGDVDPGSYTLRIAAPYSRKPILSRKVDLVRRQTYTFAILPRSEYGGDVVVRAIHEGGPVDPQKGQASIRFLSLSHASDSLSIALNNIVAVDHLRFGVDSVPLSLQPGDYVVKVWTEDDAPLVQPSTLHLEPGHAYTAVVMGAESASTLHLYDDHG